MLKHLITLTINGERAEVAVEPRWTLLEMVRETLRFTGSKEGCGTGDCGACSMIVDGRLVTSCLMLAAQADGREVVTIEGLATNGTLNPVQQAFIDTGGVQCGFCTSGMIMAAKSLLDHIPSPSLDEVREGLAGNLCRCTGYAKIYEAVMQAARQGQGARSKAAG
ncbi:MAG TPA: (2Fe-2S)-binding protein [Dehalococcoidia bacterium]|jgi:carbon-monoxide dehydrogenase small subunit|nr:(2Fe-2S)-binding protein [Dehalococcoidia bacterium]